ncbi:dUTP diphosphatase [Salimicrobium flavidum]|uniref:Dimeric dUTPase, all-alpha-NTP-PPase (MazG) superfamily n=1 Tax=Salimicrobium flavidum TaxID=570947 RepID=A0A1N7JPT7_9BACI|nr:dUTP diphosphatase [Salimicrobium flavidum]SIS51362.1 Dimeric dUTPase, all-alpha-NTP-PPase (MazG) superfamily [Salimicrobium flavidum]
MDWKDLYQYQRQLDEFIEQSKSVQKETILDDKTLAFYVELGELANETRCFKFWSNKPASDREIIKEEYVDGLHFLLSLGIETDTYVKSVDASKHSSKTEAFLAVYGRLEAWKRNRSVQTYQELFDSYVSLAKTLEISEEEMKEAYLKKHEENYERQNRGY